MKPRKLQIILALIFLGSILSYFGIRGWQNQIKSELPAENSPVISRRLNLPTPLSIQPKAEASSVLITPHDHELDTLLVDILKSKNDNDPRMDSEFKHLTPGTKELLMKRYSSYPPEARNERGTIVFILGRDLVHSGSHEDFAFYDQVATEPACLSLDDCGKAVKSAPEDAHEESAIGITLSYPQQMLTRELGEFVTQNQDNPLREEAIRVLQGLSRSSVASVAARAQKILSQIGN